jgi:hypothetical protein
MSEQACVLSNNISIDQYLLLDCVLALMLLHCSHLSVQALAVMMTNEDAAMDALLKYASLGRYATSMTCTKQS